MTGTRVATERHDTALVLTLDGPDRLNAVTPTAMEALHTALGEAGRDPAIRAVFPDLAALTGPGTFYDQPRLLARLRSRAYGAAYRFGAGAAVAGTALWGSNLGLRAEAWRAVRGRVHRRRPDVHDDLDLSFHLGLADVGSVVHDRRLHVGAAGRIFTSLPARVRQLRMAVTTLRLNWALLSPGMRWVRRARRSR